METLDEIFAAFADTYPELADPDIQASIRLDVEEGIDEDLLWFVLNSFDRSKYEYVTPNCCEAVKKHVTVYLVMPEEWYDGDLNVPPTWSIKGKSDGMDAFATPNFCPHCGTKLPVLVLAEVGKKRICSCDDGGYYCNTCSERLMNCSCLSPAHRWQPML